MKFFGSKLEYCFVSTQAETITVIDLTSDDPVASFSAPIAGLSEMWNTEVCTLVNAHWDDERQQLSVFSCDVNGAIQSSYMNSSTFAPAFALPCASPNSRGHSDIVRDVIQLPNNSIVTGGEDSRICIWKSQ
jgi:WD40 repeat protein